MSWKLQYKGNKRTQKKEGIETIEALRQIVRDKFKITNDDFELKYTVGKDKQYIDLLDDLDFKHLKTQEVNKIFVVGDDDELHSSRIGKAPKQKSQVKPAPEKKKEEKKKEQKKQQKEEKKKEEKKDKEGQKEDQEKREEGQKQQFPNAVRIQKQFRKKKDEVLTTGTRPIPQKMMFKIGDKPPKTAQKLTQDDNCYFQCELCKRKFQDGPRYRCDTCTDYDLCHICYKDGMHRDREHQFIYIEDREYWETYDMWPLLQAFINPFFTWLEPREHDPITLKQILCNDQKYLDYFEEQMPYYQKRMQRYTEKWFVKWQENQEERNEDKQWEKNQQKEKKKAAKEAKRAEQMKGQEQKEPQKVEQTAKWKEQEGKQ